MRKALAVLFLCIAVLAPGCYVAGLTASYESDDEKAAVELDEGRIECPADTPLAIR